MGLKRSSLFILLLILGSSAFAASDGTTAAQKPPSETSWLDRPSFEVEYSGTTDLNDTAAPPLYTHTLELSGGARLLHLVYLTVGGDLTATSVGNEFEKDNDNPAVGDVYVSTVHVLYGDRRSRLLMNELALLPTSEESRYQGYNGLFGVGFLYSYMVYKTIYELKQNLKYNFIANTFSISPTTLESNPDHSVIYAIKNRLHFAKYWHFDVGGGVKLQHYINDENQIHWNENVAIGIADDHWSAEIAFMNGSYDDQNRYDLWFIDQYHQVASLRLGYAY